MRNPAGARTLVRKERHRVRIRMKADWIGFRSEVGVASDRRGGFDTRIQQVFVAYIRCCESALLSDVAVAFKVRGFVAGCLLAHLGDTSGDCISGNGQDL